MKIFNLSVLILSCILTACNSNISHHLNNSSKIELNQELPMDNQLLTGIWQLKENSLLGSDNKPLTLQVENGQILLLNGCNHIKANYQIENYQLKVGSAISTRMACEKPLMDLDNLAVHLLKGHIILEKFVDSLPESSYLKVTIDGQSYYFIRIK